MCTKRIYGYVLAAWLVEPTVAWAIPSVDFGITDTDIRVGEAFTVDVVVNGVDLSDEVIAFGFDVDFDSAWSETAAPVIGPTFDYGDSALYPNTDAAGSMDFLNIGPNGDGILLATVSFMSSNSGVFDLGIVSDLLDPFEGLVTFNAIDPYDLTHAEQITVNAPATGIPEPAALILLATGIAGLGCGRRR